jgi:phage FluMu protein Com
MSIELHCTHCNQLIKAPDEAAGKMGKCPHCQGVNYIPRPVAPGDEIDLAPLDETDERKRKQAALEDAAFQRRLLHERAIPGEPGARSAARPTGAPSPGAPRSAPRPGAHATTGDLSSKEVALLIVRFVDAMSAGKLEQADEFAARLSHNKDAALNILDDIARDDANAYGLPVLPRPVLVGFLKQLRSRL